MKLHRHHPLAWLLCAVMQVSLLWPAHTQAETVRTGGSGAPSSVVAVLAAAYRLKQPQDELVLHRALGTSGGLKALRAGALDLALLSRPPTTEEASGLQQLEFARSPLILAVAASNPLQSITNAELAALYRDVDAVWPGGRRVRPILRPPADVDTLMLAKFSPEVASALAQATARPGAVVAPTDSDAFDSLLSIPGALGVTTLAQVRAGPQGLKGLPLNGQAPTVEGIRSGAYPHYKRFFMVARQPAPPGVDRFLAFVQSAEGARILAAHGCWVKPFGER